MASLRAVEGASPGRRAPQICRVIDDHRRAVRMSQRELGEHMGVSQAQASRWCKHQEPKLDELAAIEGHLGLPHGFLLRAAGYVADDTGVLAAIEADTQLAPLSRELLAEVYRGLRRHDTHPGGSRGAGPTSS